MPAAPIRTTPVSAKPCAVCARFGTRRFSLPPAAAHSLLSRQKRMGGGFPENLQVPARASGKRSRPITAGLTEPEQADAGSAPAGTLTEERFPAAPSSVICCANATFPPWGKALSPSAPGLRLVADQGVHAEAVEVRQAHQGRKAGLPQAPLVILIPPQAQPRAVRHLLLGQLVLRPQP